MLLISFLGALIGLVMGMTGAGGGILAVPALVVGLGFSMTAATPVALMAVGISAMVGALDGLSKKIVRYKAAAQLAVLGSMLSHAGNHRSEEHTSELQSLMRISYTAFCWNKKQQKTKRT